MSSQMHLPLGVSFFSCLTFSCLYLHLKWREAWKPQCLLNFPWCYTPRPVLKSLSAHPSLSSPPLSRFCSPLNVFSVSVFCIVWLPPAFSQTDSAHFDQIKLSSMPLSSFHFSVQKPSSIFPPMSEWSQDSLAWHIFILEYIFLCTCPLHQMENSHQCLSTQNVLHSWGCLTPAQPFEHLPFLNSNPSYCPLCSLDPGYNLVLKSNSSHPGNRAP